MTQFKSGGSGKQALLSKSMMTFSAFLSAIISTAQTVRQQRKDGIRLEGDHCKSLPEQRINSNYS